MARDLDTSEVQELTVPLSGGTPAGTFKVVVELDVEDDVVWPWPNAWPVTSD